MTYAFVNKLNSETRKLGSAEGRDEMSECEALLPTFAVKWSGNEYTIEGLSESCTLAQLKQLLEEKTGVRVERQKILGLKYGGRQKSHSFWASLLSHLLLRC